MKPTIYRLQSGGYEVSFDNETLTVFTCSFDREDEQRAHDLAQEYVAGFLMAQQLASRALKG